MAETVTLQSYLKELEFLLDNDAPTEVVSHCRYILQHYPKNIAAYRLLGKALLQKGQNENQQQFFDEAAEIFRRVLSAVPDDYVAHLGLGEIAQYKGQLEQALWHLERAAEQTPGHAVLQDAIYQLYEKRDAPNAPEPPTLTRSALARQYLNAGNYDQALAEIRAVLEDSPQRIDLRIMEAEALWQSERWVEAGEVAAAVLQDCPDSITANRILASLWLSYKRPTDAQPFLGRVEALDPVAAARVLRSDGEIPDAVTLPRLDYTAKAAASLIADTPEWVQDLGNEQEFQNPFAVPIDGAREDETVGGQSFLPDDEMPSPLPDWAAVFANDTVDRLPDDWAEDDYRPVEEENGVYSPDAGWDAAPAAYEAPPPEPPAWDAVMPEVSEAPSTEASWLSPAAGPDEGVLHGLGDEAALPSELESFLQEMPESSDADTGLLKRREFTGGIDDQDETPSEVMPEPDYASWDEQPSEPSDSGYALDWMNDLTLTGEAADQPGAPADSVGGMGELSLPEWGQPEAQQEWFDATDESDEAGQETDGIAAGDEDWAAALESRAQLLPADEQPADDEEPLSDDDWMARLNTGSMVEPAAPLPDVWGPGAEIKEDTAAGVDEGDGEAAEEAAADLPQAENADDEIAAVDEQMLEALRRASMPPPDVDLNDLLGLTPEVEGEAEPAADIPTWMQVLEPSVDEGPEEVDDWAPPEEETFPQAELAVEQAADGNGGEGEPASEMSEASLGAFDWTSDEAVREAEAAQDDLLAELDLPSSSLPGTTQLDAELLAFFDTDQEANAPYARSPSGQTTDLHEPDAEISTDELRWLETQAQPGQDWLDSFTKLEPETGEDVTWESAPETPVADDALALQSEPLIEAFEAGTEAEAGASEDTSPDGVWFAEDEAEAVLESEAMPVDAGEALVDAEAPEVRSDEESPEPEPVESPLLDEAQGELVEEEDDSPQWLASLEASDTGPLRAGLEALLDQTYDPFEGGREDQVPTYAAAKETGILQPDEQPEWMTAFLDDAPAAETSDGEAVEAESGEANALPDLFEDRAFDAGFRRKTGVLDPDQEADWLATLDIGDEAVATDEALADQQAEAQALDAFEDESATDQPAPSDSDAAASRSVYTPLPARQPKLNYMPDWLVAIASEGHKLDDELRQAVEAGQADVSELAQMAEFAALAQDEPAVEELAATDFDAGEMALADDEMPEDAPPEDGIAEDWGTTGEASAVDEPEPVQLGPTAFEAPEVGDDLENRSDQAFLDQLEQVDWLPQVHEDEPDAGETALPDDVLEGLGLGDFDAEPGDESVFDDVPEFARSGDLADTTAVALGAFAEDAPPDDFSFDEELPAWRRSQHSDASSGQAPTLPSRDLPEWLRPPDEDQS